MWIFFFFMATHGGSVLCNFSLSSKLHGNSINFLKSMLVLKLWYSSLPWVWNIFSDSLLVNKMWHNWWHIISKTRSWKADDFLLALSGIACSGGSQLPCCEVTLAAQWRGPHGEEMSAPASSQQRTAFSCHPPCHWPFLWKVCLPSWYLAYKLRGNFEPEHQAKWLPNFWSQKPWDYACCLSC